MSTETDDVIVEPCYDQLITGKHHVSFSEIHTWAKCSWAHKKKHIDHIDLDKAGWGSSFGTAIHAACENFLKTRIMNVAIAIDMIKAEWEQHKFIDKETGELLDVKPFLEYAENILETLPEFFDKEFKNWTFIDAEHQLYEPIEDTKHAFKGFIDAVIECDGARGKRVIWLLDFKTTGWGWDRNKRSDAVVKSQLVYYKNYWAKKTGTDPKNIRCGFVLLKRTAKKGQNCELFTISVGETTSRRSLNVINDMFASLNRGMFLKNKMNCRFCPYKMTEHCEGTNCS